MTGQLARNGVHFAVMCALTGTYSQRTLADTGSATGSLDEIVISGSLEAELPQQLAQYGTHVDTVTAEQIHDGGYLDVASSLQALAPGLYITSKNGPFDYVQISLQGSRTEDVLWLVDGVRINNRLYAGTTPLDTIPASMVERIEVLDGAQALFYGTQAVAGAVNIVTKAFTDHPQGSVDFGVDTNGENHVDGRVGDAIGGHHFVLYGSHDQSDGIQPFPGSDFQPSATDRHRAYDVTTLGAKYAYAFTNDLAVSALYQHTDAKLDFALPELGAIVFNKRDEDLVSSKLDYTPSDAFRLYVKDYYHRWSSYYSEFDNVIGGPGELTTIDDRDFFGFKDYGINLVTEWNLNPGVQYVVGYDFQNYNGRDAVLVIQQQTEHVNALFAQVRTTPDLIPGAHLAAGLRCNIPSIGQSALIWNTSGQYDLTKNFYVKVSVGTAFRLPTAEELFASDPQDERGNPDLKAESSTSANVSFGGSAQLIGDSSFNWEAITFYRTIRNLIDFQSFDAATNQDVFGNVPGKVRTVGEEGILSADVGNAWSAHLDFTYNHARQSGSQDQLDRIPVSEFKAGVDFHPHSRYGATVNVVRVGDVDDEPIPGNGRVGYGNYLVVDLGLRAAFGTGAHHHLTFNLNNLFNQIHFSSLSHGETDATGDPYVVHNLALGRTFAANYSYSF